MGRTHILIVDDDERVRTALEELMLSLGYDATCFASPRELLDADLPQQPGCLILDVRMPGAAASMSRNISRPRAMLRRSSFSPGMATSPCRSKR
jgi:FixJ family two-component response regulator